MRNMRKKGKFISGIALTTLVLASGSAYAAYQAMAPGPQANATGVTPHDWTLTPAGNQVTLGDFPMGGAVSPDGKYLVVSNDGQGTQSLQVIDVAKQQVIQTLSYEHPEALYLGVAFSPDGKTVYASAGGNNKIRVFQFSSGTLTEQSPIMMKDDNNTDFYPGGLSVSPDGKSLYVANNMNNSASQIDLVSGQIVKTTSVGKNPYAALLSHDGKTLYVSNWGTSTVTVLNASDMSIRKTINVGLHPNALAENPVSGLLYVTNSDSDTLSVIDPAREEVAQTISLAPFLGAMTGSTPDALSVSADGKTLYVANAGNNDVAVVNLTDEKNGNHIVVKGVIPTAWYPTGVYASGDGRKLIVLNAKGLGAGPNTNGQYIGNMIKGTASFIPVPDDQQLHQYTKQVTDNNTVHGTDSGGAGNPIPRNGNHTSPIKHVIYVIKENRTYDQVFGDMGKGNGDPSLTMFGKDITPNIHKLANQFVLLDNFYADAEVSTQGHNWSTAAEANDYVEKNWLADYSGRNRGYDFEGTNDATYPQAGFLWNDAARSGVSYKDYGEFMNYDASTKTWKPTDPSMGSNYDPNYPGWNLNISDQTRMNEWLKEFKTYETNGNLPQMEIVRLPNDHTAGTKPGVLTPQAMVAQNDYALGQLVDAVSHSKDWKDTAIFVTEDDAQNGLDHVDAHRTESLVISPYTQTGAVDSTFYDTTSMIRSIELILGMHPMTQFDASAIPMLNAFTNHPKLTPYTVEQPTYPTDTMNGQNAPMAAASQKMDFSQEDLVSGDKLTRVLWAATKGNKPYPGHHPGNK